jgi:hypothetical protein
MLAHDDANDHGPLLRDFHRRLGPDAVRAALRDWTGLVEVRGPAGSWFLRVTRGVVSQPFRALPDALVADMAVVGDPLALQAVFGGYLSLADAWHEGQITILGDDDAVARFTPLTRPIARAAT